MKRKQNGRAVKKENLDFSGLCSLLCVCDQGNFSIRVSDQESSCFIPLCQFLTLFQYLDHFHSGYHAQYSVSISLIYIY